CSVSGEVFIALAGRVARAVIAESPGVCRQSWTVEDVGQHLDAIRNIEAPLIFPVLPDGHGQHIRYSFELAQRSKDRGAHHG
ncbi:MAG TPA: short-chain dehydrogenase, partial [Mycobacterium sp.]|nr:short-chain dehydrogenase [Mycobacterium sp.]